MLYLAGLLSEKCDLENVTSAPARAFALEQIQKIMFGKDTPSTVPARTGMILPFIFTQIPSKNAWKFDTIQVRSIMHHYQNEEQ